jgi:hypothetical protein
MHYIHLLCSTGVDVILKGQNLKGNISTHSKQCSDHADMLINTRTKQSLTDTFQNKKFYQYVLD